MKKYLEDIGRTQCRLKPSQISGVGVFAIRPIPKGQIVFNSKTRHVGIKKSDFRHLPRGVRNYVSDMLVEDGKHVWYPIRGMNMLEMCFYLNHSKPKHNVENRDDRFIALRKIKTGEELLLDYNCLDEGINYTEAFFKNPCS